MLFRSALCRSKHFFKEAEELVALDVLGHDDEGIDIGSRTMHAQSVRSKREDLATSGRGARVSEFRSNERRGSSRVASFGF